MSTFRKILLAIGIVVVVGAVVGASVYYFTRGVADGATDFFATIGAAGPQAAYRKASPAFRQAMSEGDFSALVERAGLARFKSASWTERKVENGAGSVSGTLLLEKDVSLPAKVQLARNSAGEWQVFNFTLQLPGAREAVQQPQPAPQTGIPQAQPSQDKPPKLASSTQPGDEISADIGNKSWSADGTSLIVFKLGNTVLVNTAPVIEADHTIDTTTMRLQFDGSVGGTQTLGRDCQQNAPCLELSTGDSHYKVDNDANAHATLTITRMDDNRIEGDFSAEMISLEGKLGIHKGHFAVTVK